MVGLARASGSVELEVEGRRLTLTSLDRVLWPATGFTKGALLDYYAHVAPVLLPHVARRALTLARFPKGVHRPGFGQTECRGRPPWLATSDIRLRSGEVRRYCVVNDLPSLLWVANQVAIELHPFLGRTDGPEQPTVVAFDLDPGPPAGILDCAWVALELRKLLASEGLDAVAKTSGFAGLHVYVPLNTSHGYAETKAFARAVAASLVTKHPERITETFKRSLRAGKVLVDWLQNDAGRSLVAPYSLRAADVPTVSAPLAWHELERAVADRIAERLVFEPDTVLERVCRCGDLFANALALKQVLPR